MKIASGDSVDKGGVSILLFHCLFGDDDSITHFTHEVDLGLYAELPNLYAVCIAENGRGSKKIVAGFVIRTTYSHNDADFASTLMGVVSMEERLKVLVSETSTFLPARFEIRGTTPPTEAEMTRLLAIQHLKFSD